MTPIEAPLTGLFLTAAHMSYIIQTPSIPLPTRMINPIDPKALTQALQEPCIEMTALVTGLELLII